MGRLDALRSAIQCSFDISIIAFAVGCGTVGYYQVTSEDATSKEQRVRRENAERRAKKQQDEERTREYAKQALQQLIKGYEGQLKILKRKQAEMMFLHNQMSFISNWLRMQTSNLETDMEKLKLALERKKIMEGSVQERHRQLLDEVEELKKQLKSMEEVRGNVEVELESNKDDA